MIVAVAPEIILSGSTGIPEKKAFAQTEVLNEIFPRCGPSLAWHRAGN